MDENRQFSRSRVWLAEFHHRMRQIPLVRSLLRADPQNVIALAYHRVCAFPPHDRFPGDVELLSATDTEFDWQMKLLREEYHPIDLAQALRIVLREEPAPERAVLVTFDDGFVDNYTTAFPILKKYEIPATFFLTTGSIGTNELYWFDRVAVSVLRSPNGWRAIPGPEGDREADLTDDRRARKAVVRKILRFLKSISNEQRQEELDRFFAVDGPIDVAEPWIGLPMNWDQVREMARAGMSFGSHTVTHPILSRVTPETLCYELVESKRTLERELGTTIQALSYPVGGGSAFDENTMYEVRQAGYEMAFTYMGGAIRPSTLDRFALRRQHIERRMPASYFDTMLNWPEVGN